MSDGEAFSRVKIDAQLKDVGWNLTDGRSVRYEYVLASNQRSHLWLSLRFQRPLKPPLEAVQMCVRKQPLVLEPPNDDAGSDALLACEL